MSGRDDDCVFCQIIDGQQPASYVYEAENVVAFMDIDPVTPGHMLVIPRAHLPALEDLTDELASEMLSTARSLAAALRRTSLRCEGVNLFYADGEAAFQEVFHAHLHVIPRFTGDEFVINANWGSEPPRAELEAIAELVRGAAS